MLLVLKVYLFHHIIVIKNGFNELVDLILLNANMLYIEWVRMMQAIRVNGRIEVMEHMKISQTFYHLKDFDLFDICSLKNSVTFNNSTI